MVDRTLNNFLEGLVPTNTLGVGRGSVPTVLPLGKARRLKQAKEEAQMEVEQYRREREQEFQSKQQAVSGGGAGMDHPPRAN